MREALMPACGMRCSEAMSLARISRWRWGRCGRRRLGSMAAKGCWLVPTLTVLGDIRNWAAEGKLGPAAMRRVEEVAPKFGDAVRIAREAGVKIALGTDFISREQHGTNLREIASVVDAGLSIEAALLAATRNGAELLGIGDRYGRVAQGYVFDAIVLDDDPADLAFARDGRVGGVFKAGRAVVEHPRLAARPAA